ncbi:hypothetical protein COT72_01270 [archaeon CG10_big_fil_rev_8_21_14_0_10_43_11]|nr:MAG: hypothetical protein COT72_01270 [archaeon CG10_big_fil_rev_8_21_14_0_10_43_11]
MTDLEDRVLGKNLVHVQSWIESERGWGTRPDGWSFHLSRADYAAFVKNYWDAQPDETPDEYSRPAEKELVVAQVTPDLYARVKKNEHGLRLYNIQGILKILL